MVKLHRRSEIARTVISALNVVVAAMPIFILVFFSASTASGADLVDAAQAKAATTIRALLAEGADVNERAPDGTSALHWAAYHDDAELVSSLLNAGANPNFSNDYGSTPLREAAVSGNVKIVEALLEAGADVDAMNSDGETALMLAARSGHVEIVDALVAAGADVNVREAWRGQTAAMWAAAQNQPSTLQRLLTNGADPNVRSFANDWDRQVSAEGRRMYRPFGGLTALILAAREGCAACIPVLADGGADLNLTDTKGVTALYVAIDNLHFDTAMALIDAGADPNRWDWWGRTPLYGAVDMNTLPAGGRPDRRSVDATTGLELIARLLDAGANPNAQLKQAAPYRSNPDDRGCDAMLTTGMTPLLRAAKTFDVDAIELLLAAGARTDLPNALGITPIMAAAGMGSSECDPRGYGPGIPHYQVADTQDASIAAIAALLDGGADINARAASYGGRAGARRDGQTAIFGAAAWGWNDVVRYLADRGATLDLHDEAGFTVADAALGRAGRRGRGATGEDNLHTARLLQELCAARESCDPSLLQID